MKISNLRLYYLDKDLDIDKTPIPTCCRYVQPLGDVAVKSVLLKLKDFSPWSSIKIRFSSISVEGRWLDFSLWQIYLKLDWMTLSPFRTWVESNPCICLIFICDAPVQNNFKVNVSPFKGHFWRAS